ncbi:MAG: oxidoreductase [Devosia sp.]|nr:oxidoreductase [Devosia sp.]
MAGGLSPLGKRFALGDKKMRLLILGTGNMAARHAEQFSAIDGVTVVAGIDIDPGRLEPFLVKHGIGKGFSSLDPALEWNEFDAIANVTPDAIHHPTTMAALAAGKHVFCEKPLATDALKALEMTEAAERAGLIGMVNLTYRNVAQLQAARTLVLSGAIGSVKHVEASYLQGWLSPRNWLDPAIEGPWLWRLSKKHGSNGVLGDLGIHIVDFASYGSGLEIVDVFARLKTFEKTPGGKLGAFDLDANDSFSMSVSFENGALGVIHSSRWATGHSNDLRLRIYGEKGGVEVQHGHWGSILRVCMGDDIKTTTWREMPVEPVETNYQRFVTAVRTGEQLEPSFRHATNLQKVLDLALVTDAERREHAVS